MIGRSCTSVCRTSSSSRRSCSRLGLLTVATRRNAVAILMGVELILNAAALNFVAFAHFVAGAVGGMVFALFIIVLAAAEAAIALAIVLAIFRHFHSIDAQRHVDAARPDVDAGWLFLIPLLPLVRRRRQRPRSAPGCSDRFGKRAVSFVAVGVSARGDGLAIARRRAAGGHAGGRAHPRRRSPSSP